MFLSQSTGSQEVFSTSLLIVGAGVRPRQELAERCGLELGGRGGIKVARPRPVFLFGDRDMTRKLWMVTFFNIFGCWMLSFFWSKLVDGDFCNDFFLPGFF